MINHSKACSLLEQLESKMFLTRTIVFCPECFRYSFESVNCEHEYMPMKFTLSNNAIQIRLYCTKCHSISSRSEPHSNYDLSKLPTRYMDKYKEYYESFCNEEEYSIRQFTDNLNIKANDFNVKDYNLYLQSDHWKEKRMVVLERDNNECQMCGKPAECVHHLNYNHRGYEYLFELVSLCNACHQDYHAINPEK